MSLTIYLEEPEETIEICKCFTCGHTHEFKFFREIERFNITHNLVEMANEAGIYEIIWCPDKKGIETAGDMIGYLDVSINELIGNKIKYEKFNPKNGWGSYMSFLKDLNKYLELCKEYPKAKIRICK